MSLPMPVTARISQRFESLVREGEALRGTMEREEKTKLDECARNGVYMLTGVDVMETEFHALRTKVLNLIGFLGSDSASFQVYANEIRKLESRPSAAAQLVGVLKGMADDFSNGFLDSVVRQAEAEVAADYLGQAERLLEEGQPGQYDHIPAAVLMGAVFEKSLRTICSRQTPPVEVTTANNCPKKLVVLIDDLKKAGVFNELKAKQLRAWADIRNAAAHGELNKFTRADVDVMKTGITNFLGEHL